MTSEPTNPPPGTWLTSRLLAELLARRRDNDIKVDVGGILVPIQDVVYWPAADAYVIELVDGEDLRVALAPDLPSGEEEALP